MQMDICRQVGIYASWLCWLQLGLGSKNNASDDQTSVFVLPQLASVTSAHGLIIYVACLYPKWRGL